MAAHQAPQSLGFSRQEHWSGLPFPSPMHESEKKVKSLSHVRPSATPWTAAYQAPLSRDFPGKSTGVGCHCLLQERKVKYAFLAAAIKGRDQPGPSHPRLKLKSPPPPDAASDATSQDTGQRHVLTRGPPQKCAQPVVSGATGRWTVPRDALTCLGRSPPPRPGEWNVHRDNLAPLERIPTSPPIPSPTL